MMSRQGERVELGKFSSMGVEKTILSGQKQMGDEEMNKSEKGRKLTEAWILIGWEGRGRRKRKHKKLTEGRG